MVPQLLAACVGGGVAFGFGARRWRRRRCVSDLRTVDDVVRFVEEMAKGGRVGGDALVERIEESLSASGLDEDTLARLSVLEQAVRGRHDKAEFCVVTLYAVAMTVVQARATGG